MPKRPTAYVCLFVALLLHSALWAQSSDELRYAPISWKLNDSRTLERVSNTRVTRNDSTLLASEVSSRMRLKVLKTGASLYEIEFQDITVNDKVSLSSDMADVKDMERMVVALLEDIQAKVRAFKYVLLVDRETGQAVSVKNEEDMAAFMEEVVVVVLSAIMQESKVELSAAEHKELQLKLKELMAEQMPAALRTVVNAFNYMFQGYAMPYVPNGTHSVDVEMYYIDEVQYGDKETTATQDITAREKNGTLNLDIVNNEDQRASYQLYVVDQGLGDEIPFGQFRSKQRTITDFDLTSTWITRHESVIEVTTGSTLMVEREVTTFKR